MASLPSRHSQAPEMVLGGEQNTENTQAIVNDPTGKNLQDWDGGRKKQQRWRRNTTELHADRTERKRATFRALK